MLRTREDVKMLKVTKVSDHRVDIELDGVLDQAEMQTGLDALLEASSAVTEGKMLYRIADFSMPTLAAIGVEIGYMPKLFALLGKFKKCAVVSDQAWLRTAAEIEGRLIPGLEIKSFTSAEVDAAETWLEKNSDRAQ